MKEPTKPKAVTLPGKMSMPKYPKAGKNLTKQHTHTSGADKDMDQPGKQMANIKKEEKGLSAKIARLKEMGQTFMDSPRQEEENLIARVARHPFDRLKNVMGDMKAQSAYRKNDSFNKMRHKEQLKKD